MIGTTIGRYEILSLLGAGGMGEVYQARDTRLGRVVAVKILPKQLAEDRERIQRFEREARLLASLNHVNIATLFGFEEHAGTHFLVMELIDGATLAERIARGPIPLAEALTIARQIAEALEAAHEKGVVHRDLKPANVKITTDGKVKVLDFGLAKAMIAPAHGDFLSSPTISVGGTYAGVVLGTAPYMSPEQARGLDVDPRSDVFAFGCVLFEMLTGRRSFPGDTVTDAIASVLAREPDMATLPPGIHPRLHEILRRCLEKDQRRRWQAVGDLRVELEAISLDPHGLSVPRMQAARRPLWAVIAPAALGGAVVAAAVAAALWSLRPPPPPAPVTRFSYALPRDQTFTRAGRHVFAISPDGSNVVYVANNQLYLKPMADMDAKPIAGTAQDVDTPFFSPDGKWIAFAAVSESKLKKVAVTGGAIVTLAEIDNPYGAFWAAGDQIFVGQGPKGIVRVSANGGKPETVVTVKPGEFAQSPQLLPDGDHLLFTLAAGSSDERWDQAQIVIQSLHSGARTVVVNGGTDARYVPTGHVIYTLGATVFALPFNLNTMGPSGGPVPVLDGVSRAASITGAVFIAVSENGSLGFVPGSVANASTSVRLAFMSRNGQTTLLNVPQRPYFQPRLSPDGRQLAVEVREGKEANIWVYDVSGTTAMRRLTFSGNNRTPIWARDGRVVFTSDREGDSGLFWQLADGSGPAERLTTAEADVFHAADSWSPTGAVIFERNRSKANNSLWFVFLDGDRKPRSLVDPLNRSSFVGDADVSPDGKWLLYSAGDSTSGIRVYAQPFPPNGAKYEVSPNLTTEPAWSSNGREIFYADISGRTRLMAVDVRTQPSFDIGTPAPLRIEGFEIREGARSYDITPDGKRFLVMLPASETTSGEAPQINVVLNWFQELKQRAPARSNQHP